MSTRDRAIRIINKLNERQLEGFINMFIDFVDEDDEEDEKYAAYLTVKKCAKKSRYRL